MAQTLRFAWARVKAFEERNEMFIRDGLTSLYNHRHFQELLRKELLRAGKMSTTAGILLVDIDHFAKVNESHDLSVGDNVLVTIGKLLMEHVRIGVDTVSRFGGDAFALLLIEPTEDSLYSKAEEIRKMIHEMAFDIGKTRPLQVTVSIGFSFFPQDGVQPSEMLDKASNALKQAKANGRNTVTGFSS